METAVNNKRFINFVQINLAKQSQEPKLSYQFTLLCLSLFLP